MGLFDSIQDLISGATDSALGSVGDAVGGITDIPLAQEVQDQVSSVANGANESISSVNDQAQTAIDNIAQNFKL